jgi:tetratricopeptide (TPR) repeat protein
MAILSQSRGGAIALLAGAMVGVILLNRRSRRGSRWAIVGLIMTVAALIVIVAGGRLFDRLLQSRSDISRKGYPKAAIWAQSFALWTKFPALGTGMGTYETAMSHYKTGGGEYVILHAENDYLELLVETGLIGFIVIGIWLFRFSWRLWSFALVEKMYEPELVLAGLAAVTAFAVHAVFEFVFHITATALLAAAILGLVAGNRDRIQALAAAPPLSRARISLNLLAGVALLTAGLLQGMAFWHWHRATEGGAASEIGPEFKRSVELWPWNDTREITLARAMVASGSNDTRAGQLRVVMEARERLQRALRWNPYSWQLRLERAWLDLASSPDRRRAHDEAFETVRLSPLQSKIPLRFAGQFVESDPDFALQMLRTIKAPDGATLAVMLRDCWQITGQTSDLWALTPDTVDGLTTLATFALEKNLAPLAVQAWQRLKGRMDPVRLAAKLIDAQRPDLALELLEKAPSTPASQLLTIRANIQAGDFERAMAIAEGLWQRSRYSQKILTPVSAAGDLYLHRARWKIDPRNRNAALQLAEKEFELPPGKRDLSLLNQLSLQFSDELRLTWIVYRTEADLKQYPAAADIALRLATAALAN